MYVNHKIPFPISTGDSNVEDCNNRERESKYLLWVDSTVQAKVNKECILI